MGTMAHNPSDMFGRARGNGVDEVSIRSLRTLADFEVRRPHTARVLTLILADAEFELVPQGLTGHPSVYASARKRGRSPRSILLDSSVHHPALKKFPEGERRGRPDIVHVFLLLCLDSILNQEGALSTIVHTRNDDVLRIAPHTRIPRNYTRFVGLVEELFHKGSVPDAEPLITLERGVPLKEVLEGIDAPAWAFVEDGERLADLGSAFTDVREGLVAVLAGFPHGGFRSPVRDLCDRVVSIHAEPLKAWTVASEILVTFRRANRD